MSGYGTGVYGVGPFGIGVPTGAALSAVYPSSDRTVAVLFTQPVLMVSPLGAGDALNPQSYSVVRNDTGEQLRILTVRAVTATAVELFCLERLADETITHTLTNLSVQDAGLGAAVAPYSMDFPGMRQAVPMTDASRGYDYLNTNTAPDAIEGTLQVSSAGDYEMQRGESLLRKLILRRLSTPPGGFKMLGPGYGVGLREKDLLLTQDLVALRNEMERQVLEEPEVSAVAIRLSLSAKGILTAVIRAEAKDGVQVEFSQVFTN